MNMQCIKEYKPSTTVQFEQTHYNKIQRMEKIEMTLQVTRKGGRDLLHSNLKLSPLV